MNNKAQLGLGVLLTTFVAIVVGLALWQGSFSGVVATTELVTYTNNTFTAAAVNSTITLNGQSTSGHIFTNATSGVIIPNANFTVSNYVLSNGQLISTVKTLDGNQHAGRSVNVSYTSEPFGYQTNGGSRSIIGLILIFAALAIAVVALIPTLRSEVLGLFR